jgi:starvation-inducible outer membrane lipoprotein
MLPARIIPGTITALLSLVLLAGCASSPDPMPGSSGYASVEQIEGDPDRMVCQRQKETGSRLSTRVCKTAREWEQERLENQEAMRNATKSPTAPSSLPSAGGG